ncbi:MAG: hypothetical protein CMH93_00675 [Oceanicaulis sp.]|uniref:Uncharacterized protein n=1 Tax=Maricaulis virginensis TaxID=144022 RepID=A0A9W6IM09_9PROT|nr:hypothetical protein [Maricaulis virginensis]MAC38039.1 hypothetical protein [Oceanicaulis sp.]GLK52773.1 hypothetical protein GCM10017621_22810 [Maricaulis virginensis]
MTTLPLEFQLALVSFATALLIGGPVTLIGASNLATAARMAGGVVLRRRMMSGLAVTLASGAGLASAWPF